MTTTTAKLASAKLNDAKGIDDQVARSMYDAQDGKTYMAIVELGYNARTDTKGDKHTVTLEVTHLELAAGDTAEHLRELSRALYTARTPTQVDIDTLDDVEPDAAEIIRRGKSLLHCGNCVHPGADDRIRHKPKTSDDPCTWAGCGHDVFVGQDECTHPDHSRERAETNQVQEATP